MKRLFCFIAAIACALLITGASRFNSLTTSGDSKRYSVFTASGNRIAAYGRYEGDRVVGFDVTATTVKTAVDLKTYSDGRYEAVFEGSAVNGYALIYITLMSGDTLRYRVDYNNGWYFGDYGGISEHNAYYTENYAETDLVLTVDYLVGENGSENEAEVINTLRKIKELSDSITEGIDSDYEKARAITKWVAENIYYDYAARDKDVTLDTIALNRVLDGKKTVCSGYANLTAALSEAAGLKAVTVIGAAANLSQYRELPDIIQHHEWTAFWYEAESRWVIMDSGWDSGNVFKNGKYQQEIIAKRYFDASPLAFAQDHRADKVERRVYFDAPKYFETEYSETSETTTSPEMAASDESVSDTETEPIITEPISKAAEQGDVPLYIAAGVTAAGVVIMIAALIKLRK